MKKIAAIVAIAFALTTTVPASAQFNWGILSGLLGGATGGTQNGQTNQNNQKGQSGLTGLIGGILEGVFSTSNIEVADMAGQWTVDGSAVTFKSENFLQKAGGIAAASAIQQKLDPYFKKYGLTGAILTIQPDGSCTLVLKRMTLKGNFQKAQDGNFLFNITLMGRTLSSIPTYVQKTSTSMDIMFDANKLKEILGLVARISGSKLASTASTLLNQYEGICIGFSMQKTGNVTGGTTTNSSQTTPNNTNTNNNSTTPTNNAVNTLINLFKPGK